MKSSMLTMISLVIMTSYLSDACYFTNCPNRWNWNGKRSDKNFAEETLKQRAEANPLLKSYLDKVMMETAAKAPQVARPQQNNYDDILSYDDVIIEELLKELLEEKSKTGKNLNIKK